MTLPRLDSMNSPLTGWTAFPLTLTSASESTAIIFCVTKYALQRAHVCLLTRHALWSWGEIFFSWLQAFFCGRSDYFRALLEDHFSEGEQLQSHPSTLVITLHNISHEVFIHVMYYIYTDKTEVSALLLFGLFLWRFLSFNEKNVVCTGWRIKRKSPMIWLAEAKDSIRLID